MPENKSAFQLKSIRDINKGMFAPTDPLTKAKGEPVYNLPLDKLIPFKGHPFKLYSGQRFDDMVESIKTNGVLVPIIVRPIDDFTYEVLSGHNRIAEVKAIATGNPMIKRKMELDIEVQRLRILESQYRADKYSLEDNIAKRYPKKLARLAENIKGLEADITRRDAHTTLGEDGKDEFHMRLGKHEFTERKDAGEMLLKAAASNQYAGKVIGFYRGFEIIPQERDKFTDTAKITLKGTLSHTVELSDSDVGSIARIENSLNRLEERLSDDQRDVESVQQQLESSKAQLTRPFEQEEALQMTISELESVNAELDVDKGGDADAVMDDAPAAEQDEDVLGLDEETEADTEDEDEDEAEM